MHAGKLFMSCSPYERMRFWGSGRLGVNNLTRITTFLRTYIQICGHKLTSHGGSTTYANFIDLYPYH